MHHYLPKKVPQTKIKFYQTNAKTEEIEEEVLYVAEHLNEEEKGSIQILSDSRPLLSLDIQSLLAIIESNKMQRINQ